MEPEIVAAIVGGAFAIFAAFLPYIIKRVRDQKEEANSLPYVPPEGLSAVVGVVQKGNEILMVQRKKRIRNLSWQFPAGVVKPGTDLRDKIENEVLHETGVRCKVLRFLGSRVHEDTRVLLNYVHCIYLGGEVENLEPDENSQVAWVNATEVHNYVTSSIYTEVEILLDEIGGKRDAPRIALGIVVNDDKVLVVRSRKMDNVSDWRFPGGVVEKGESEANAAAREVFEETGVICTPGRKLGERIYPDTGQTILYWLCKFESGKISVEEPEKFSEVVWMSIERVISVFGDKLFGPVKTYLQSKIG